MARSIFAVVFFQHGDRFVLHREAIDSDTDMKTFVEYFIIGVVRLDVRNQPQLLRIRSHQRGTHHEWSRRQVVRIGTGRVWHQRTSGDHRSHGDWRPGQSDENSQPKTCKESQKYHHKLSLVHGIQSHMDGSFTAIVMIGRGDVLVKLAEQITELRQGVSQPQKHSSGCYVRVTQPGGILWRFGCHLQTSLSSILSLNQPLFTETYLWRPSFSTTKGES